MDIHFTIFATFMELQNFWKFSKQNKNYVYGEKYMAYFLPESLLESLRWRVGSNYISWLSTDGDVMRIM